MSDERISILGSYSEEGYTLEIYDEQNHLVQKDGLKWVDFPYNFTRSEIVLYLLTATLEQLGDQPFILEYHCGSKTCFGAHVITDEDTRRALDAGDEVPPE